MLKPVIFPHQDQYDFSPIGDRQTSEIFLGSCLGVALNFFKIG
jgi:hypothetical protein